MNYRKTRAEINTAALRSNTNWLRRQIGPASLLAVVKADAYGHGVGPVCATIADSIDGFAVGFTDEAIALKEAHPNCRPPILILEGCQSIAELQLCGAEGFRTVVHSYEQLKALELAELDSPVDIWLKVNTGMHRLGIPLSAADECIKRLEQCRNVGQITLMSHLANADSLAVLNQVQLQQFQALKEKYPDYSYSLHNSAAVLSPQLQGDLAVTDWVRAGLLLYGVNPSSVSDIQKELTPVMSLKAPVIAVNELKKGDAVGYGSSWVATRATRIATVAIGYADGYPRQCKNGTPTFIRGQQAPLIGRVSMDMITIDVGHISDVTPGDDVELWGQHIDVREVARQADTISWHLLTATSVRVPRVVVTQN
ncbi:alanine racemase [Idiomarina seosinensis]|uniref:alanine racemase n=1 Tax=Idiomarina seosinensis TaxID=281739 RepID=UPI003850F96A